MQQIQRSEITDIQVQKKTVTILLGNKRTTTRFLFVSKFPSHSPSLSPSLPYPTSPSLSFIPSHSHRSHSCHLSHTHSPSCILNHSFLPLLLLSTETTPQLNRLCFHQENTESAKYAHRLLLLHQNFYLGNHDYLLFRYVCSPHREACRHSTSSNAPVTTCSDEELSASQDNTMAESHPLQSR